MKKPVEKTASEMEQKIAMALMKRGASFSDAKSEASEYIKAFRRGLVEPELIETFLKEANS